MALAWLTHNGIGLAYNGKGLALDVTDPYNPLDLGPYTIRVVYGDSPSESWQPRINFGTATRVSLSPNVWDITYENSDWSNLLRVSSSAGYYADRIKGVLGANSTGVTNMSYMFYGQSWLGNPSPGWYVMPLFDTSAVTDMSYMFNTASITGIPVFDTSNVTNMECMFSFSSLESLPLINTSKVTNMRGMFEWCTALNTAIPLIDTSSVTDMSYMFHYCNGLPSTTDFDTSSVTNMDSMFEHCISLERISNYDTINVVSMQKMMADCTSLLRAPVFRFHTGNVQNMWQLCYGCKKLQAVPQLVTTSVTNINVAFYNCLAVAEGALSLYNSMSSQANPPQYHSGTFTNCGESTTTGLAELNQIPTSWGGRMQ